MTSFPPTEPLPEVQLLPPRPKTSGLAIASLICAIAGVCTAGLGDIAGIILGILALVKISKSQGKLGGKGLAIAGLIVSGACLVLAAVAIASVLRLANETSCRNNLMQVSRAAMAYAASHRQQRWPSAESWDKDLVKSEYLTDRVLTDPADPGAGRAYAINRFVAGKSETYSPQSSRTVLFFECAFGSPPGGGLELLPAKPRHPSGYVIAFCDGHVESVPKQELDRLIWDPAKEGGLRPSVPLPPSRRFD